MLNTKTRFAPSPSGLLHIGNVRTAFFSALYAYKNKGDFFLRIEDSDSEKSQQYYIEQIFYDLKWLKIPIKNIDNYIQQSKREKIYQKYFNELKKKNLIYPCFCSPEKLKQVRLGQIKKKQVPKYDNTCRNLKNTDLTKKHSWRFKIIQGTTSFKDKLKTQQIFKNNDIGDFIIKRADNSTIFLFNNAIDDTLMDITLVIRGEDHISNTPRQIMLLNSLEFKAPEYLHLPLIIGKDKLPLSKRNNSLSINHLREKGYFSLAITNYLIRIGHSIKDNDILNFEQMIKVFDIKKLSKSKAFFDIEQLDFWQNKVIMSISLDDIDKWLANDITELVPLDKKSNFISTIRNNILLKEDATFWAKKLFSDFTLQQKHIPLLLALPNGFWQKMEILMQKNYEYKTFIENIQNEFNLKGKKLFLPIRLILSGVDFGPKLEEIYVLLGPSLLLNRVKCTHKFIRTFGE